MRLILSLILMLLAASCAGIKKADKLVLQPADFSSLSGWSQDYVSEAIPALLKSCDKWKSQAADKPIGKAAFAGTVKDWQPACDAAATVPLADDEAVRRYFTTYFSPYRVTNDGDAKGLFTGYYEIDLHGSKTRSERYHEPLYKLPPDKVAGSAYYTRKEIDEGALVGKGLELVYVDDPVQAFFLHIQGSGRITLDDGTVMRVGFAGQNGHPYTPIGRYMLEQGLLEKGKVSANSIKDWLRNNPEQARFIMQRDVSFIFFKDNSHLTEGPIGAQGVPLTTERSLAVDRRFIPLGVPLWLDTTYPTLPEAKPLPLRKLFIAQDTGGAIKGVVRGDVFFGNGKLAEDLAGYMKNKGSYYMLLPKGLSPSYQ
jgi:membrane-bound lytic murein transglycosylase A